VSVKTPAGETLARLKRATYACHHYKAVQPLADWFADKDSVAVIRIPSP
jgi:hypothetical protein